MGGFDTAMYLNARIARYILPQRYIYLSNTFSYNRVLPRVVNGTARPRSLIPQTLNRIAPKAKSKWNLRRRQLRGTTVLFLRRGLAAMRSRRRRRRRRKNQMLRRNNLQVLLFINPGYKLGYTFSIFHATLIFIKIMCLFKVSPFN